MHIQSKLWVERYEENSCLRWGCGRSCVQASGLWNRAGWLWELTHLSGLEAEDASSSQLVPCHSQSSRTLGAALSEWALRRFSQEEEGKNVILCKHINVAFEWCVGGNEGKSSLCHPCCFVEPLRFFHLASLAQGTKTLQVGVRSRPQRHHTMNLLTNRRLFHLQGGRRLDCKFESSFYGNVTQRSINLHHDTLDWVKNSTNVTAVTVLTSKKHFWLHLVSFQSTVHQRFGLKVSPTACMLIKQRYCWMVQWLLALHSAPWVFTSSRTFEKYITAYCFIFYTSSQQTYNLKLFGIVRPKPLHQHHQICWWLLQEKQDSTNSDNGPFKGP